MLHAVLQPLLSPMILAQQQSSQAVIPCKPLFHPPFALMMCFLILVADP